MDIVHWSTHLQELGLVRRRLLGMLDLIHHLIRNQLLILPIHTAPLTPPPRPPLPLHTPHAPLPLPAPSPLLAPPHAPLALPPCPTPPCGLF